ncbi:MAG: procyclic acidic repetitive family protein [Eubacteriales bacterium]|nr:procyclic acidic repetitive family protein [Eubacteriales bacterium]MDD3200326.1 procyclic acidic repetitive family protein [Eubacteriales bacterium]
MKKKLYRTLIIILLIITLPFPAYADYGPISIDGYYDDWEDKPHTEVYPGKNPPDGKVNYVSLFRDEANVYVHVVFADKNNQGIKNMTIDLKTNLGDMDYYVEADNRGPNLFSGKRIFVAMKNDNKINIGITEPQEAAQEQRPESNPAPTPVTEPASEPIADPEQAPALDFETEPIADTEPEPVSEPITDDDEESVTDPASEPILDPEPALEPEPTPITGPVLNPEPLPVTGPGITLLEMFNLDDIIYPNINLDGLIPDTISDAGIETDLNVSDSAIDSEIIDPDMIMEQQGDYGTISFTIRSGQDPVGSGYFTTTEGAPDELEFYIPLSSVTSEYDGITEISMVIKKLGKQEIISVGASTFPYVGIAFGAGIAILSAGVYAYDKKKKA